jgi:hypothetical protein
MKDPNRLHVFKMNEDRAMLVHRVIADHTQAMKNWIASAVEHDDFERAKALAAELREYQALFAAFNMEGKHSVAEASGAPVQTIHSVR